MAALIPASILDKVSKTTIQLLLKEPFYGHFFTGLIKDVTETVPTMAVGATSNKMVKLYINPTFWEVELNTPAFRYGVLKHEILHIVFKHILTGKSFANHRIYNIAADIVVNQYIDRALLPDGCILIEQFTELPLEPNQDVGYYYHKLLKAWQHELDTGEILSQRLSDVMQGSFWVLDMHDLWQKQFEEMTESERQILDGFINDVLRNAYKRVGAKGIGNLPLGLQTFIGKLLASLEPSVDWRRTLRIFAGNSMRSFLKNTIRRPSKRYGTTPGIKIKIGKSYSSQSIHPAVLI